MTYEISEEQLQAFESDYMTKDTIAVITKAIRNQTPVKTNTEEHDMLMTSAKMIQDICNGVRGFNCVLYAHGVSCHNTCPKSWGETKIASCAARTFISKCIRMGLL